MVAVQGFRTYPSFLHFLASVTFLAAYIAVVCIRGLIFAFSNPLAIVRTRIARVPCRSQPPLEPFPLERIDARAHALALVRRMRIHTRHGFLPRLPHIPRSVRLFSLFPPPLHSSTNNNNKTKSS